MLEIKIRSIILLAVWVTFLVAYTSARSIVGYSDVHGTDEMRFVTADAIKMGVDGTEPYLDQVNCQKQHCVVLCVQWACITPFVCRLS